MGLSGAFYDPFLLPLLKPHSGYLSSSSVSTGSFLANPHFVFSLSDPDPRDSQPECSVVISLAQKPKEREHRPIGFRVYRVSHHLKKCALCSVHYS